MTIRIIQIWNGLSLRLRLFLPLGFMFLAALLLGALALHLFTTTQLAEENEQAVKSTKVMAEALNSALASSDNPKLVLEAFVRGLGSTDAIRFRAGTSEKTEPVDVRAPFSRVPPWFTRLLTMPEIGATFPVMLDGTRVGDIVFSPDLSVDIYEKWVGFLAILGAAIVLTLLTWGVAYLTAGSTLAPLQSLNAGLTQMRQGRYDRPIQPSGPPEIRRSCEAANELASTLDSLSRDNRNLLRKVVSLQDDERRHIARELHDELGPLLFGIRANSIAVLEAIPPGQEKLAASTQAILQSVEALQQANRRILDHLRPLYIQELGLEKSVRTLIDNARAQAPEVEMDASIDPRLNKVDGLLSQTIYRVIQEGTTNALRHANASSVNVDAAIEGDEVAIGISDDGIGFPAGRPFGRGLTGMHERVRALSGTFELLRENGKTLVRCRLPIGETALRSG